MAALSTKLVLASIALAPLVLARPLPLPSNDLSARLGDQAYTHGLVSNVDALATRKNEDEPPYIDRRVSHPHDEGGTSQNNNEPYPAYNNEGDTSEDNNETNLPIAPDDVDEGYVSDYSTGGPGSRRGSSSSTSSGRGLTTASSAQTSPQAGVSSRRRASSGSTTTSTARNGPEQRRGNTPSPSTSSQTRQQGLSSAEVQPSSSRSQAPKGSTTKSTKSKREFVDELALREEQLYRRYLENVLEAMD